MLFRLCAISASLIWASIATAGQPTVTTDTCPVGGEEFKVIGTTSCSNMGLYMTLRRITSCDFVTHLPVCPSNGLPLYTTFNDDQIAKLETFVTTDRYAELQALSPWHRAYEVARHLGQLGTEEGFSVTLGLFWHETSNFRADRTLQDAFMTEVTAQFEHANSAERPFLMAILAYAMALSDRSDEAKAFLARAQEEEISAESILIKYLSQVETCIGAVDAPGCAPTDPLKR